MLLKVGRLRGEEKPSNLLVKMVCVVGLFVCLLVSVSQKPIGSGTGTSDYLSDKCLSHFSGLIKYVTKAKGNSAKFLKMVPVCVTCSTFGSSSCTHVFVCAKPSLML